ncbi:Hint domain-containing protein, partial [Planktotalea sp.]|uniref:Hint domain-containing protein n=1 Tax=Planktotalea sp. TaxID=2029877 RepID=UPI0032998112
GDTDDISPGGVDGSDTISGGAGDDVIYGEGGGDRLFGGAGSDNITGGAGDDTISGGADDDTLTGGIGDDSIDGDAGDDFIGGEPTDDTTILDWGDVDANGTFTLTGSVAGEELGVTVTTIANATGQTANAQSSGSPSAEGLWVSGLTSAVTSTLVFDEPVNSANFEIYDIDQNTGSWDDMLTIIATDAEGNEATVTFSDLDGLHSVDNDTLNADGNASTGVETTGADDSVTVSIAGPFVQIVFTFDNGESASNSGLFGVGNMTLDFTANADDDPGNDTMNGGTGEDTIYAGSGDDSLSGGIGDDELHGQEGDDVFNVAEGDSAYGGDGDDYFSLVELNETPGVAGNGIYIEGGEGDETVGDTLNLGKLGYRGEINYTNTDDANGGLSGTLVLHDGTLLTFENIEKIICFTPGTMIATPKGPRAVETLKPGDLVTTRDNGAQAIRWMGQRTLPCMPGTAPVRFEMGSLEGLTAPLLVSPQHKMLIDHCAAELLFGEQEVFCKAKHMVGANIGHQAQKMVTYIHMMLDAHEVVFANGVASESFHAGPEGIPALSDASKADLFANFPELENDPYAHGPAAYPCLKAHETALLMQDIAAAAPLQDIALAA